MSLLLLCKQKSRQMCATQINIKVKIKTDTKIYKLVDSLTVHQRQLVNQSSKHCVHVCVALYIILSTVVVIHY